MRGLRFVTEQPVIESAPARMDIACFIGFVARRQTPVPRSIVEWLMRRNYAPQPDLLELPVPIDNWDVFDRLFAWERRPSGLVFGIDDTAVHSYMGAAVRSFFAQGGRKCYVVRVGDAWPLADFAQDPQLRAIQMAERASRLIPGFPGAMRVDVLDETTWRGAGHLSALPDVSLVCLPDLPDLARIPYNRVEPPELLDRAPEIFVECSDDDVEPEAPHITVQSFTAPRVDNEGFEVWAKVISALAQWLTSHMRVAQIIAAVPIPQSGSLSERGLLELLADSFAGPLNFEPGNNPIGIASPFVQLVYPWVRTRGSDMLPERLEAPDAVLAGVLARNALTNGAFRTIAGQDVGGVNATVPLLSPPEEDWFSNDDTLIKRVSLIGNTPDGYQVLSDVTASDPMYDRPANIRRLIAVIVRAAGELGETLVFEPSGERLWEQIRVQMSDLLRRMYRTGALRGASEAQAFSVRCDRSTMTQNDIDNGRVLVEIWVRPSVPIDAITVVLAMAEGHPVSLQSVG